MPVVVFVTTVLDDYEKADFVIIARVKSVAKATMRDRVGGDISNVTMVIEKCSKAKSELASVERLHKFLDSHP